jgi:N-acetylglucosamine kinase-like BadF-type ATPase
MAIPFVSGEGLIHPCQSRIFSGGYNFRQSTIHGSLTRDQIASLCPAVVRAAAHGDEKAIEILRLAGQELGQLGTAVIQRLGMEKDEFAVVPFGGVFRAGDWVLGSFKETIHSVAGRAQIILTSFEPVIGAVLLGLDDLGITIDARVIDALERSTPSFPPCRMNGKDEL